MRKRTLMLKECRLVSNASKRSALSSWGNFLAPFLPAPQLFHIAAECPAAIVGAQGTHLKIPAFSFADAEGRVARGLIEIKLSEVYTLTDIILSGMPATCEDRLLEVGGYFRLQAWQDGQPLELLQPLEAVIPLRRPQDKAEGWQLFLAGASTMQVFQSRRDFDWKPSACPQLGASAQACRFQFKSFVWIACGRFAAEAGRKNMVTAKLSCPAESFDYLRGFLVLPELPSVVRMYPSGPGFTAINIAAKLSAKAIIIGQRQGQLYYGHGQLSRIADKLAYIQMAPVQERGLLEALRRLS